MDHSAQLLSTIVGSANEIDHHESENDLSIVITRTHHMDRAGELLSHSLTHKLTAPVHTWLAMNHESQCYLTSSTFLTSDCFHHATLPL